MTYVRNVEKWNTLAPLGYFDVCCSSTLVTIWVGPRTSARASVEEGSLRSTLFVIGLVLALIGAVSMSVILVRE